MAPARTRVAFTIDELKGNEAKGLVVNRVVLQKIARDALAKLDDFEEAKEPA